MAQVWRSSWLGRYRPNHDLRRTGGTLSAVTGATLKELMARLGR